jgi:hypothetical protein
MKNGGGENARATGGPGILPETKEVHWFSRTTSEDTQIPGAGQDV